MAALLGILPMSSHAGAADRGRLQAQCWTPQQLAGLGAEKAPRRGVAGANVSIPRVDFPSPGPVARQLRGAIRRVDVAKGRKLVALTFDFCEQPGEIAGYDGAIIDYLRRHRIKATLFMGGKWLLTHGERAQQLASDPLFEIANHGWAHRNLRLLDARGLVAEIEGPQRAYEATRRALTQRSCVQSVPALMQSVAARPTLFRFPFGACNALSLDAVANAGLLAIQWDVSTGDPWPGQSAKAIANIMVRNVRPGSIVLAHANGRGFHTGSALPLAIPKLKALGYEFVTVSELLAAGKPVITASCYDARPGDTDKYDHIGRRIVPPKAARRPTAPVRAP